MTTNTTTAAPPTTADKPSPTTNAQLARREDLPIERRVAGSFRDTLAVNDKLAWAARSANLIAPAPAVGRLPEGCAVAFAVVRVDARDMAAGGEVYRIGVGDNARFALGKSALDRIAAAAGLSWIPELCRRLDDGSDPYFCAYQAAARVRYFDGTEQVLLATKEVDLRDGSPQIESMKARSKKGDIRTQLREMRLFILGHAESKAKNRVIRSLGLKTGYTADDIAKPFVVSRLMFTGETEDPELRREFAKMQAEKMLGSSAMLYGSPAALPPRPPPAPRPAPPPAPVHATVTLEDDGGDLEEPAGRASRADDGEPTARFGKQKGTPLSQLSDDDLAWYAEALEKSVLDPAKAKYRRDNESALHEVRTEQRTRGGEPACDSAIDDPGEAGGTR